VLQVLLLFVSWRERVLDGVWSPKKLLGVLQVLVSREMCNEARAGSERAAKQVSVAISD
jgi:hypothetical protein